MSDLFERLAQLSPEKRALLARRLAGDGAAARGPEPIAIVGLSCRFPGACDTPEAFWALLSGRVDAISEVPRERWNTDALYDADATVPGKVATKWGGFVEDIDRFDPYVFGISPREAARMDPQQRLWLEVAWEAFERAGLTLDALAGSQTGVFLGLHSHSSDYFWLQLREPAQMDAFTGPGNAHNIAAGRLAYLLDLRGPAITIDTACSSSLVATHMACQSLRAGDCRTALVGGVNALLSPVWSIPLSRMQMLSPTGRCRAFDASADGFVRSEGAGAVVLKRLSDALADEDAILAVIRGSAINQDGRTNGITAPNGLAQRALLRAALANAGVPAAAVTHVETHGTGTALGDPIEFEALAEVFGENRPAGQPCWIGAVKSNVGHLEGAAGIAGLIKVVLSLQHRSVPPVVHFSTLNAHIAVDASNFPVPTRVEPWTAAGGPRIAGVSSFGWSGTNAHLIVEEAPDRQPPPEEPAIDEDSGVLLLTLSARSPEALRAQADRYRQFCASGAGGATAAAVCRTAALRRTHHEHRLAVVGDSIAEFQEGLASFVAGDGAWTFVEGRARTGRKPGVAFVFTGQGPQWPGMGLNLMGRVAAAGNIVEQSERIVRELAGWSLIDELAAEASRSHLDHTEIAQPAIFVVQAAIANALRSWGVEPTCVIGHSVGEIAAAWFAGALSLEDALRVAVSRGRLMERATGAGRMVSIERSLDHIRAVVTDWSRLSVAAVNGPASTVLSGETDAIEAAVARLTADGAEARYLPVQYAFHSEQVAAPARELEASLVGLTPGATSTRFISTVTGAPCAGSDLTAAYWRRNVRDTVRFADAIAAVADEQPVFLEIGPHPALRRSIAASAAGTGTPVVTHTLHRGREGYAALRASLGTLYTAGCSIDWQRLTPGRAEPVPLPTYAWQRERFWLDHVRPYTDSATSSMGAGASADADALLYAPEWVADDRERPHAVSAAPATWLVLADRGGIGARVVETLERNGHRVIVEPHKENAPLDVPALTDLCRRAASGGGPALRDIVYLWTLDSPVAPGSAAALSDVQADDCAAVVAVLRAAAAQSAAAPRLWIGTRQAQAVAGERAVALQQAAIWGLSRTAGIEHPSLKCTCIDLPAAADEAAAALVSEIGRCTSERELAFRNGSRLVRRLVRVPGQETAPAIVHDGAYLITGGLGALGLETAEWLVAKGAKHLVLTGRSAPRPAVETRLSSLRARGVSVDVVRADVSRDEDVARLFEGIGASGFPLRGIVHSAGVLDDGIVLQLDRARFQSVFAAKIAGAWNLHVASAGLPLDFFVLYSSLASVLGSAGQGNYAAANAFLDSLAGFRASAGLPALSVNWGRWGGTGMAASLDEADQRRLSEAGFEPMDASLAFAALERAIGSGRPQVAVMAVDWPRYEKYRGGTLALLSSLGAGQPAVAASPQRPALLAALDAAPRERARHVVLQHIRRDVLAVLGLPATHALDDEQGLRDAGLDSLMALELKNRLQASTGRVLPSTVAFDYPTTATLAAYVAELLEAEQPPAEPPAAVAARLTGLDALASLSEDEASALLAEELADLNRARGSAPEHSRG